MDVYKIKIYPTAKQDLREIIDYLNTLSQQAALRYSEQFDAYMRREMSEDDMKLDEMCGM